MGKIIGMLVALVLLPFAIAVEIISAPFKWVKAQRVKRAMQMFTLTEQELIGKAHRSIMQDQGLISIDRDIRQGADRIMARCSEYIALSERAKLDQSFLRFIHADMAMLAPRAADFFEVDDLYAQHDTFEAESSGRIIATPRQH